MTGDAELTSQQREARHDQGLGHGLGDGQLRLRPWARAVKMRSDSVQ